LVDIFAAIPDIRVTRARVIKDDQDFSAKYVMPLSDDRRRKEGSPAMADSLGDFKRNWAIFTEGSLSQLIDWSNVVTTGGSVLACLSPLPADAQASKRNLRNYYHSEGFLASDVDLFLWGLTPEQVGLSPLTTLVLRLLISSFQAEVKMNSIYEAVRDSVPLEVTCIRTKHMVSIHCKSMRVRHCRSTHG
jgi:hypothetical protein